MHRIDFHGLRLATIVVSSYGDSMFNAICCLVATEVRCAVVAALHCTVLLQ
jgi:hypothetical protein